MNIIELRASGFARLSAVTIRPDGALVQITGRNGAGKTSCLNAIWTALVGRAVAPVQPINKNAEEARISVDLGTMVVQRTFRRTKHDDITSDLKVTMADGARVSAKPQAMIDALLGDLSFNPLEFAKLPAKEQFERVTALVPNFDFEANAARRQQAFDERTIANRKAKDATARANGVTLPPGKKPAVADTATLGKQLHDAMMHNRKIDMAIGEHRDERAAIEAMLDQAEELRAKAKTLEDNATMRSAALETRSSLPEPINTDDIASQIASADGLRQIAQRFDERERHINEADQADAQSHSLTQIIDECDSLKAHAISQAKMPVQGLSFGEAEVLLNGLPFSQAGTAEKIAASVGIAMALNPELRVILIDEGSELDSNSLKLVASMASDRGYQVWMARVDETGQTGFVIEDGHLKETTE